MAREGLRYPAGAKVGGGRLVTQQGSPYAIDETVPIDVFEATDLI
jgi:hypothetical protein